MNSTDHHSATTTSPWNRNFSLLFLGQAISELGSVCYTFGMLLWLEETFQSLSLAGAMTAAVGVAGVIGGTIGGTAADRYNKRKLLINLDLVRAIAMLLLLGAFSMESLSQEILGIIFVLMGMLLSMGSAAANPIAGSLIPAWVPQIALSKAIGWAHFTYQGVGLLGRAIAGILYTAIGASLLIFFNAASFFFAALMLLPTSHPPMKPTHNPPDNFLKNMVNGLKLVFNSQRFRPIFGACSIINFFTAPLPLLLVFHLKDMGYDTPIFGYTIALLSAGGLLGTAAFPHFHERFGYALIKGSLLLLFPAFAGLCIDHLYPIFTSALALGFCAALFNTSTYYYIQEKTGDASRGRFLGIFQALSSLMVPLGLGFCAILAQSPLFSPVMQFLMMSAITLTMAILLTRVFSHSNEDPTS